MHIKGKYTWLKHLDFMFIDLITLIVSFVIAYRLKFGNFQFINTNSWTTLLVIICLLNVVISLFSNPYSGIFRRSYYEEIIRAILLTGYNLIASCVIFYIFKIGELFSREMLLTMYGMYFFLSLVSKYVWKKLIVTRKIEIYTTKQISLFVVGDKSHIKEIIHNASAGDFQLYDIKGICLVDNNSTGMIESIPVVASVSEFADYVVANNISEVLIAVKPSCIDSESYEKLVANGIGLHMNIESMIGFQTENQFISSVGVYKTLSVGMYSFTPGQMIYLSSKRIFDICCGLIGLVILIPITAFVKVLCLMSGDTAPIFYTQKRVGRKGKLIKILKFRSMVPNAGEILEEMLKEEHYRLEWEANQKFANDPRITKVGKILRKTSIDELPQLINVLKGDMSLVGPRPLVVGELEAHGGLKLYQQVKPGITGWWGCNGRSNIDYRERLELEYYYVKNCSLYLDILCVFRTVLAVLKRDGAE